MQTLFINFVVEGWEGGLVHGDATQLQQQGLAELHLHGSVQTGEALRDVSMMVEEVSSVPTLHCTLHSHLIC